MSTIDLTLGEAPRRPSWKFALFMGTIGMLVMQLTAALLALAIQFVLRRAYVPVADDSALMMFLQELLGCIAIVLPLAYIREFSFSNMRARYGLRWGGISRGTFVVAAVGMFALGAEMVALSTVLERVHALPRLPHSSFVFGMLRSFHSMPMATRVVLALSMGIFPGLSEEMLFRGQVQRALLANWSPVASVVVTSAMFALAHIDPAHYLNTFAFACWVGWIAARSDAILPGMVLHALNNSAIGFAMIFTTVGGVDKVPGPAAVSSPAYLGIAFVALLIVALCARFLDRRLPGRL